MLCCADVCLAAQGQMAQCAPVPRCCRAEAQPAASMADGEAYIKAALPMCGYLVRSNGQVSLTVAARPQAQFLGVEVLGRLQPSIQRQVPWLFAICSVTEHLL